MSGAAGGTMLDRAKAHFMQKVDKGLSHVLVPEWGEAATDTTPAVPAKVYFGPETAEARDEYFGDIQKGNFSGFVKVVISRARTAEGRPMFAKGDTTTLMKSVDPSVITRIAVAILSDVAGESVEDAGKS